MLVDNNNNAFATPAPIFDNGLAFLGQIEQGDLDNIPALFENVDSGLDIDFQIQLELATQPRHIAMLEKLKGFTFTRHTTHNLPQDWFQNRFKVGKRCRAFVGF